MNQLRKKIQIINKSSNHPPTYQTEAAAGMDLAAFLSEPLSLAPHVPTLVPTGIHMALPNGFEGQVRSRSSVAKKGVLILNAPGTIDSDYRGEIKVLMMNLLDKPFTINNGDRIAQLVVAPYVTVTCEVVDKLPDTVRGEGGFGSTGVGD